MKRQNQFDRTDRDITNALLSLMDRKPFEKITVQYILEEAMINRSTFYQHFPDKYAILERLQEKIITGLTERISSVSPSEDMEKINTAVLPYLSEHRQQMRILLSVRSEHIDMEKHLEDLLVNRLLSRGTGLSEPERGMLSGMVIHFITWFLNHDFKADNLTEETVNSWLNMTLYFFRLEKVPDAKQRILTLVGEMHQEKQRKE